MAHGDDSEAWRGDEPEPRPTFGESLLSSMFGRVRPMTAEEKAAAEADIKKRQADAAVRALVLGAYRPEAACPKCGGAKVRATHCTGGAASVYNACYADTAGQEHLHRECKRCRFVWYEKTLDAVEG